MRDVVVGEVGQVATEGVGLDGIGTSGELRTVDVSISGRNTARFEYCTSASRSPRPTLSEPRARRSRRHPEMSSGFQRVGARLVPLGKWLITRCTQTGRCSSAGQRH